MEALIVQDEIRGKRIANQLNLGWDNDLAIDRVDHLIQEIGPPQGKDTELGGFAIWNGIGGYKRIMVVDEANIHYVPEIHVDFMRSIISYTVPTDKIDDVRSLSESVQYDNIRGELSASCHFLGANIATLYLATLVAAGEKSVIEARRMYEPAIKSTLNPKNGQHWYKFYCKQLNVEPINDGSIPNM